jgi:hypothetical protein
MLVLGEFRRESQLVSAALSSACSQECGPPFMIYVWPSGLLLMLAPGDKHPVAFSIMLVVSVALNALLYSALFFAANFLRCRLRGQRSDV